MHLHPLLTLGLSLFPLQGSGGDKVIEALMTIVLARYSFLLKEKAFTYA